VWETYVQTVCRFWRCMCCGLDIAVCRAGDQRYSISQSISRRRGLGLRIVKQRRLAMRMSMLRGARLGGELRVSCWMRCVDEELRTIMILAASYVSIIYPHTAIIHAFCPFHHKSVLRETFPRCCSASHINRRDRFRVSLSATGTR
jgi:hypothetical protein